MKHLKKFNEEFISPYATDEEKESLAEKNRKYNELKEIKIKLYESQNPPMVDVFQDLDDYLLDIREKHSKFQNHYGTTRDAIDFDDLDLVVDIGSDSDYVIAHEKNYIWRRGERVNMEPSQIETTKKLSMYGSDFDWEFLDFYKKHNGKVNPFYSILIGFDSDYKDSREEDGWSEEQIKEMTNELRSVVESALRRLGAKIVKVSQYNPKKIGDDSWEDVPNLESINYPRISVGFRV